MPRKPRVYAPGAHYHAILRGNNRQLLFRCVNDYQDWLELLEESADRYGCRLLAYCWMSNHVHMAVQVSDLPLGRFIQYLAGQYARRFNRRHSVSGHLFERRHRAILVDSTEQLLALTKYIHRNPIDAGLVQQVRTHPWCSHRYYLKKSGPPWLNVTFVLSLFGQSPDKATAAFDGFIHGDSVPTIETNPSYSKQDDWMFRTRVQRAVETQTMGLAIECLSERIHNLCNALNVSAERLRSKDRARVNARLRAQIVDSLVKEGAVTVAELARFFNRSESVILRGVQRYCQVSN